MLRKLIQLLERFDRAKGGEVIELYRVRLVDRARWSEEAEKMIAETDADLHARFLKREPRDASTL